MPDLPDYSGVSILLVDDEENILRSLKRLFSDEDFSVLTATSGEQGLEILKANTGIGLIVSDQRMPGMGGAEFLSRSRKITPDAIRMILTGYADVNAAIDSINKAGADRYLVKPWDDAMLINSVRDGIDRYLIKQENIRLTELVCRQNEELQEWNSNLKKRVMEQTSVIRQQNEGLSARNNQIRQAFQSTILAFSRVIELCGERLRLHTRNVTALATGIARDMNVSKEEYEDIRIASLLHDIGLVGVPESIIEKHPSQLNREETEIFKQHSVRGQSSIDSVEELRRAGIIIRHHHEQYNGKGYPDGLAGDAIPLGSRIISYADFIDIEMQGSTGELALEGALRKATLMGGIQIDPKLGRSAQRTAKLIYYTAPGTSTLKEREYQPDELSAGLRITRDLYTGTGLLLLTKGAVLDSSMIDSIRRYYDIDPPTRGIRAVQERIRT